MHWRSPFGIQSSTYTTGAYAVQRASEACTSDTILGSISECSGAKAVLDADAGAVESENYDDTPKGCSRYKGKWYFNTHETGTLDGASDLICKATFGDVTNCIFVLFCSLVTAAHPFPLFRQMDTRGGERMRHQVRSGIGIVGHTG